MARQEQDREDLLREASALVERIELQCPDFSDPIVVGFRRNGEGSIFIGADAVIQLNSRLELRRGFLDGQLLKAEKGKLVSLERQRTPDEVQLLRTELSDAQSAAVLERFQASLATLRQAIQSHRFTIVGQVPIEVDVAQRVAAWLNSLPERLIVAAKPNVQ